MFGLNDGMRYYVCQRYVRMNLGINGLYKLVSQEMDLPPLSGAVFIFFSKNRQQVKLLRWDTDGFTLYQKRLERDTFEYHYPGETHFSSGHMPVPNGQPCSIRWHTHADCKVLTSLNTYLM